MKNINKINNIGIFRSLPVFNCFHFNFGIANSRTIAEDDRDEEISDRAASAGTTSIRVQGQVGELARPRILL